MTTDTPKRDVANLDAFETWFASLTRMERDQRFSASYFMREAWNAALRLPTPPSQGKVSEEMVEVAASVLVAHGEFSTLGGAANKHSARIAAREALTAAITQALTESSGQDGIVVPRAYLSCLKDVLREVAIKLPLEVDVDDLQLVRAQTKALLGEEVSDGEMFSIPPRKSSGQGTDGAEAMREACVAYHIKQELLWDESDDEKAEEMARYHQQSAFALQNLPLPPSPVKSCAEPLCEDEGCPHYGTPHHCISSPVKESRDEVTVPEALLSTCLGVLREMDKRCAVTGEDWESDYTLVIAQLRQHLKSNPHQGGEGK